MQKLNKDFSLFNFCWQRYLRERFVVYAVSKNVEYMQVID